MEKKKCIQFLYKIIYIKFLIIIFILINKQYHSKNKIKLDENNSNAFYSIKNKFFNMIKRNLKINITYINSIYIIGFQGFGNFIISLNNAIILCELLRCEKIIIEYSDKIFIKNRIFCSKINLTIEPNYNFNYASGNLIILKVKYFFYIFNFKFIGKVNRFDLFRNEIMANLPKIKTLPNELFIYIRGGDVFRRINRSYSFYPQPPLCFYETILSKFKFNGINIISEDKLNPVTSKLLNKYPYIKYKKKNIIFDISYLANSYNIVSAKSSFITSIIKLNYNLKFLWEYDLYKLSERYLHLHYSVYTFSFNYTIYKMNTTKNYKKIMFPFRNSEKQRKLMFEEKCNNNFDIIPPRRS